MWYYRGITKERKQKGRKSKRFVANKSAWRAVTKQSKKGGVKKIIQSSYKLFNKQKFFVSY